MVEFTRARQPENSAAIVASASPLPAKDGQALVASSHPAASVQRAGAVSLDDVNQYWEWFRCNGLVSYFGRYVSNAVSRASLIVEYCDPETGEWKLGLPSQQNLRPVLDMVKSWQTPTGGQQDFLRDIALHLSIAGLAQILSHNDQIEVLSEVEAWKDAEGAIHRRNSSASATDRAAGRATDILPASADLLSIKFDDPTDSKKAYRPLAPVARAIELYDALTRAIESAAYSRAGSLKILVVPESMDIYEAGSDPDAAEIAGEQVFVDALATAMRATAKDPSDPGLKAPIIITAPDDLVQSIKVIDLSDEQDKVAAELRGELETAIAAGLMIPREQLLGLGGASNYTASTLIDSTTLSIHVMPILDQMTAALTAAFVVPAFGDMVRVRYDRAALLNDGATEDVIRRSFQTGLITLDESRVRVGLQPIGDERGDMFFFELWGDGAIAALQTSQTPVS